MAASSSFTEAQLSRRAQMPIPSAGDFFIEGALDAAWAWENFGGLTLDQAYAKFLEYPENYQEDFMWMFPKAFEYYFPVVDRYLRSVSVTDEDNVMDGCNAYILGCDIEMQFHWKDGTLPPDYVVSEISALSGYVKTHLAQYSESEDEQRRIEQSWLKVDETIAALT